jgi:hypothetical protein
MFPSGDLTEVPQQLDTKELAKKSMEHFYYFKNQLDPVFKRATRHWRLYLAARKETAKPTEKWRSWVHVPYPFSGVQTVVGSFLDLLMAQSPPIVPNGIGPEDILAEKKIERLMDYQMRKVDFESETELFITEMLVQGIAFRKSTWIEDIMPMMIHVDQTQIDEFEQSVSEAVFAGMPMPPGWGGDQENAVGGPQVAQGLPGPVGGGLGNLAGGPPEDQLGALGGASNSEMAGLEEAQEVNDPQAFEQWRQEAQASGFNVPEAPIPGPSDVVNYRGTGFDRISMFDVFYDPALAPWKKQDVICIRTLRPKQWIRERTGQGPEFVFDPAKVNELLDEGGASSGGDTSVSEWQTSILEMMGISVGTNELSPKMKNSVELLEFYQKNNPNAPYQVVMNREDVINKDFMPPYWHGEPPLVVSVNNRVPGVMPGFSELHQTERLYYEMNTLRGLRIDGVLISVLPIFLRLKEAGMVELAKKLIPGMIMEATRGDAVTQVSKVNVPVEAFTEIDKIKQDIDETNATFPNMRGAPTGSGTTATEANRAFENAMARTKQRIIRFEGDISRWVKHSLFNWYQFADPVDRVRVGGDPPIDPFVTYRRNDFLAAIDMDYAFRSARNAISKDLEVQQLKDLMITMLNAGIPEFKAVEMAKRITNLITRDAAPYFYSEEEMQQMAEEQSEQQPPEGGGQDGGQEGAP